MPGIRGLLAYRPETAEPLMLLAEVLLRGDSTLSRGERELIAAYVSRGNECEYCAGSHGASAAALLPGGAEQVEAALGGPAGDAPVSGKMRALLEIASLVRVDGRLVSDAAVARARGAGATDREIHDTVLIAATFCMFNRYVDGLGTSVPDDPAQYAMSAAHLVRHGYQVPRVTVRFEDLSLGGGYVAGWACTGERYRRGPGGERRDHRRVDAARGRARGAGRGIP